MGRKAFFAALCWLAISGTRGGQATEKSLAATDSESAESAPRLYRNVPFGVYASAAPHGAYSIQIPTFLTSPKAAASRIIPVTEIIHNNGYLKDSYGNKFVGTPTSFAYKSAFPQQFVQLQELPAHLSQPLVAAGPSFRYKQPAPFAVGSHYTLPLQAASPQHRFGIVNSPVYAQNIRSLAPFSTHHNQGHGHSTPQQQSTSNKAVYTNTHSQEQYNTLKTEPKFQRLQEAPKEIRIAKDDTDSSRHVGDLQNAQLQAAPAKQTSVTTVVNGQKTVIQLDTKPLLPLLDISLLEPLTFDNPLVPQVQHFLPRISEATYHKLPQHNINDAKNYQNEFMVQKTKSYDSGIIIGKPRKPSSKKKQKKPTFEHDNTHQKEVPVVPTEIKGTPSLSNSPEITYEINSPNYKETYKEQAVSYNKETESEPVHYTYGSKTEGDPVHYSFVRTSKEPEKNKDIRYQSNGEGPRQLIYNEKPDEQHREQNEKPLQTPHQESGNSEESGESEAEGPANYHPTEHNEHHEHREEAPQSHQPRPEHREEEYHHDPNQGHHKVSHHNPPQYHPQQLQVTVQNAEPFHPITHYEENIRFIPTHKTAHIKVDPDQHIQRQQPVPEHQPQHHPSPAPSQSPQNHQHNNHHNHQNHYLTPSASPQHIQEKSRHVIIQEETPEEMHSLRERVTAAMIDQEENNEEDFEKAYKNAAFGFPAYDSPPANVERDIYNPDNYGVPRDEYDVEHTPFQQYQGEGDEYPKTTRLDYKDTRDKTKEDYFLDYSISRPESLTDRYKNKVEYYKLFKNQKPERYVADEQDKNDDKQNSKYTAAPSYAYSVGPVQDKKPKQHFAQYKAAPQLYQYDYRKAAPRDNSAYASRPLQSYKSKTNFVEPQFQYGFEPLSIPRLLDSELAAMASNDSPESEKPGMRKKLYKENWYIKKTSTSDGDPTS